MNLKPFVLIAALSGLAPWPASAATDTLQTASPAAAATTTAAYTDGEIKKIDAEQGKVTLKHGAIDNLGMPGMTMVFRADAAVLARFKPGDAVKFKADRVDGAFKVTELVAR